MDLTPHRIVVLESSTLATATAINAVDYRDLRSVEFVLAADTFIFVARGEVAYRFRNYTGRLVENTLLAIPPGFRHSAQAVRCTP
jgi:hypothetical protein